MLRPRHVLAVGILCLGSSLRAQVTNTAMTVADAFLCTGSPNYENGADLTGLNFGGAGTLAVAPPSAPKGEFQSVIQFNLSNGPALFNAAYGSNNWTISGVSLQLTSNYGTAGAQPNNPIFNAISGGQFVIEWLSDNDWLEGTGSPKSPTTDGVTYGSLPLLLSALHEPLCTNTYVPPGDNVPVTWPLPLNADLVADIAAGGSVTFRFYAADNQVGYLFNSREYGRGNQPLILVAAAPLLRITSGSLTNGAFHLTGIGNNNAVYQIQASPDLSNTHWQTIGMATASPNGAIQFDDTSATNQSCRFYRLTQ